MSFSGGRHYFEIFLNKSPGTQSDTCHEVSYLTRQQDVSPALA